MSDLITRLHTERLSHPSTQKSFSEFADEWISFISHAKFGMFQEYFEKHHYPIPDHVVEQTDYVRREGPETSLMLALEHSEDLVLLGNEGCGKTTLVHYVFGVVCPKKYEKDCKLLRTYVDVRKLDAQPNDIPRVAFSEVFSQLTKQLPSLGDRYETWIERRKSASTEIRILLTACGRLNGYSLALLMAFLADCHPDLTLHIAIDNIDSLSMSSMKQVLNHFEDERKDSRHVLLEVHSEREARVALLVPCRHATWTLISTAASGEFHLDKPRSIEVNHLHQQVWDLTKAFIKARFPRGERGKKIEAVFPIPVSFQAQLTIAASLPDILCAIAEWIKVASPEAERLIAALSGHSIRRMKMFALKVLGNALVVQNWFTSVGAKRYNLDTVSLSPATVTDIVREALFDAMQPIGSGELTAELIINPFGVLREDSNLSEQSPLIGVTLLRFIKRFWAEIHTLTDFSDELAFTRVFAELRAVGYRDDAIRKCVETFCMGGVLRPIRGEPVLLPGDHPLRKIYSRYILDAEAFEVYWSLVFRTGKHESHPSASKENSVLFMNACERLNYQIGYVAHPMTDLYRAFMNIHFLRDCHERDHALRTMAVSKGYKGDLESYFNEIFSSLHKKWFGMLREMSAKYVDSIPSMEFEMFEEANSILTQLNNSRMSRYLVGGGN